MLDIEELNQNRLDHPTDRDYTFKISAKMYDSICSFIKADAVSLDPSRPWQEIEQDFRSRYHDVLSKKALRYVYEKEISPDFPQSLVKNAMRSENGVFVVSVVTSPYPEYIDENGNLKVQRFSCKHNCVFCPTQPNYPKSYLEGEPGVDRAYNVGYDVIKQIHVRLDSYVRMGHKIPDKIEIITLGGTWSEYPKAYRDNVILDIYYGVNSYDVTKGLEERYNMKTDESISTSKDSILTSRERMSLSEEIKYNETNDIHIIGLTLETRPDSITLDEIRTLRAYNCTRVQIGVQHTDNAVLKTIKRGHTIEDSMRAIKLLLDNGFKVDIHLMPNLPGSSLEQDKIMVQTMLTDTRLRADQWKVYPTSVVPWSILERWYKQGKYEPYGDDALLEFLLDMKSKIPEWIRLNRIVRDIPTHHINGGCQTPHMRQLLHVEMRKRGITCRCIRCRSVKQNSQHQFSESASFTKVETYEASGGIEHFISHVSNDNTVLFGFARLRIPDKAYMLNPNLQQGLVLEEIHDCALVRELHVYGKVSVVKRKEETGEKEKDNKVDTNPHNDHKSSTQIHESAHPPPRSSTLHPINTQHRGVGKLLMAEAERLASMHGYGRIAVIAGVGVREYYRRLGFELAQTFMIKELI